MVQAKILLMSASPRSREALPRALRDQGPNLSIETAGQVPEALAMIAAGSYDAAVLCADTADELSDLIRIKKRNPTLPIVMLTRVTEPGFGPLATSMGAATVVRKTSGLEETAKALAMALETQALLRAQKVLLSRSSELVRDIRTLCRQNRKLVEMALGFTAAEEENFHTLLVEDDPDETRFLLRSVTKAKLPVVVHTVVSAEAAMEYLTGAGPYRDRERHPFPALVISDLKLGRKSGLELLEWMRSRPETRQTGFIMLTVSERDADIDESYRRGANLYLVKQDRPAEIVDVMRTVLGQYNARKAGLAVL